MALVAPWDSQTNPADGTALGQPAGFQTVTTGAGTSRTWRTAVASQANTGVAITTGGGTDALRTNTFTGNLTLAHRGILTTPTANPATALTVCVPRTSAGVGFRFQWSTAGAFTLLDSGSTTRVIAAAGVMALNTRYGVQAWFTAGTSTTGVMHVLVTNMAGTTVATYDATTINLGTVAFTHLDYDPGQIASNYGWSEIGWDDGRASFIPLYAPAASVAITATGTGTPAGTATLGSNTPLAATGTAPSTGSVDVAPSLTISAAGSGIPTSTTNLNTTIGIPAAATNNATGSVSTSINTAINAAGAGTATGTAPITAATMLAAAGTNNPASSGTIATATNYRATGTGTPTALIVLGYNDNLTAGGTGTSTGIATLSTALNYTAAGSATNAGSATLVYTVNYDATGDGYSTSTHKLKLFQPGRDITVTATLEPRRHNAQLSNRAATGTLKTRRWGGQLG